MDRLNHQLPWFRSGSWRKSQGEKRHVRGVTGSVRASHTAASAALTTPRLPGPELRWAKDVGR